MLARYTMYRGKRPDEDPLPQGIRQDTRKHTRHILRPPTALVLDYLNDPSPRTWEQLKRGYRECLEERYRADRKSFDALADLAARENVYLGCNCPTRKNPDVNRCHTVLALHFMKRKYPHVEMLLPE